MRLHYSSVHQGYVNSFNQNLENVNRVLEGGDPKEIKELSQAIKYCGGGHINYEFFWDSLAPMYEGGGVAPSYSSELGKSINKSFGSFENFVSKFSEKISKLDGSSWSWLAYNKQTGNLEIKTTKNHG